MPYAAGPISGEPRSVKAVVERGDAPGQTLAAACKAAGLVDTLEGLRRAAGVDRAKFRIAVKLDIAYPVSADAGRSIVVNPAVAVALHDFLTANSYSHIRFVDSRVSQNRAAAESLHSLAQRHGYGNQITDRLVDMVDNRVEVDLGSTVGRELVGRDWLEAEARIVVGKNRTHSDHLLWGSFGALVGCFARPDRHKALREGRRALALSAVLLQNRIPAHFAILDAVISGDGAAGDLKPGHANQTSAILASPVPLALDWLAAELMGLDPALSPFLRESMLREGVLHLERIGNLTEWTPWRNVSLLRAAFAQLIDEPRGYGPELAQ